MSDTENLLSETLMFMAEHGKTPDDVRWVGDTTIWFSWDEFANVANVEYDAGFGGQEVASDLLVVGDDWWMERHEYDGTEWWEFKTLPTLPSQHVVPRTVFGLGWTSLADANRS